MIKGKSIIARMSLYKNALNRFKEMGLSKVFSDNIADSIGAKSTQVRKDFSVFGITGNKRGGYLIDDLLESISRILGKDKEQKVILVGAGHLGEALVNYSGFHKEGIKLAAAFDVNPLKYTDIACVPVFPMQKMDKFIKESNISIAIIAVPDTVAQNVADQLVNAGIIGIVNFAPVQVKTPPDVIVNNVDIALEIENLIYYVKKNQGGYSGD